MPQNCRVCVHEKRTEIEEQISLGKGKRRIGAQFGVSEGSVRHHAEECIKNDLALARAVRDMVRGDRLAGHLAQIYEKAKRIGEKAEQIGDEDRSVGAYAVAMQGVREETRISEFYVNAAATLAAARARQDDAQVVRTILLEEACPACREAIARRLISLDHERNGH